MSSFIKASNYATSYAFLSLIRLTARLTLIKMALLAPRCRKRPKIWSVLAVPSLQLIQNF
jgi:hypothetical protein